MEAQALIGRARAARLACAAVGCLVAALASACRRGRAASPEFEPLEQPSTVASAPPPTYADVAPILAKHCTGCHVIDGVAPFFLTSYDDARAHALAIAEQTRTRNMPPWGANDTEACRPPLPFRGDERLSDKEIATLGAWAVAGAPLGDARTAALATIDASAPTNTLPNTTVTLWPDGPHVPPPADRDSTRCFVLDPKMPEGAWLDGLHIVADDPHAAHHALLFTDPGGIASAAADATASFDCPATMTGGIGNPDAQLLEVWAPGVAPIELPPHVGFRLPPQSKLVLAVRYQPVAAHQHETWLVHLRLTLRKPDFVVVTRTFGNYDAPLASGDGLLPGPDDGAGGPAFVVPAGARAHVEEMQATVPDLGAPARLLGVMAHMNLAGTEMSITAGDSGAASATCLLHAQYNFHWQHTYAYDAPIESLPVLAPGQKLRMRCTYDNSRSNPHIAAELDARRIPAPFDLRLGEGSLDEMCLFVPQLIVQNPE